MNNRVLCNFQTGKMMNTMMYRQPGPHFPVMPYVTGVMQQRRELNDEENLASVSLQIQKKRFYVDVKKNRRGRFMKIAEVSADGHKARILLTMPAAAELREKLKDLLEVLAEVLKKDESGNADNAENHNDKNGDSTADGLIKSHIINCPNRRYYLDLKRNRRGLFLRLAMLSAYVRVQLAVPSQGIAELLSVITELLEKWWDKSTQDENKSVNLPPPKSLRVDNKIFYFDSLASPHRVGAFLRISEVKSDSRTAITIPARSLVRFKDVLNELSENLSTVNIKKDNSDATSDSAANVKSTVENGVPESATTNVDE